MSEKRRRFTPLEKAKIALAALKGETTIAEIVSKYSVHATQVKSWKKQAIENMPEAFKDSKKVAEKKKEHTAKLAELYEQIGRLKVENEFLKKKCSLFAE